jgi:hypothetical protein
VGLPELWILNRPIEKISFGVTRSLQIDGGFNHVRSGLILSRNHAS